MPLSESEVLEQRCPFRLELTPRPETADERALRLEAEDDVDPDGDGAPLLARRADDGASHVGFVTHPGCSSRNREYEAAPFDATLKVAFVPTEMRVGHGRRDGEIRRSAEPTVTAGAATAPRLHAHANRLSAPCEESRSAPVHGMSAVGVESERRQVPSATEDRPPAEPTPLLPEAQRLRERIDEREDLTKCVALHRDAERTP